MYEYTPLFQVAKPKPSSNRVDVCLIACPPRTYRNVLKLRAVLTGDQPAKPRFPFSFLTSLLVPTFLGPCGPLGYLRMCTGSALQEMLT